MARIVYITFEFIIFVLLLTSCNTLNSEQAAVSFTNPEQDMNLEGFHPTKIRILPLTEMVRETKDNNNSYIHVYLALIDQFGSQIKKPGILRFELYGRVLRSAEPKGKRIQIWPDMDLTDPIENNNRWHDFLRAYEFRLDFEPETEKDYILQVTYIIPNGRRLFAQYAIMK